MQKIAEFNSEHSLFNKLGAKEKIVKISELRNIRIETTKKIFGLDALIYHCVTRKNAKILVYETPMDSVVVEGIKEVEEKGNSINFNDGINKYSFNSTKSTLYKRFMTKDIILDLSVEILADPFDALEKVFGGPEVNKSFSAVKESEHIFLPLYSMKNGNKVVSEKSGLNQWNAEGRQRDSKEVYIPIPAWIHAKFPDFFPGRDTAFVLSLPDGGEMSAKVCQDGSKALMSNPNSALGQWILRDILDLKERELLTYLKLQEIGLDSVVIYKVDGGRYDIDFTRSGSYEEFKTSNEVVEVDAAEDAS